jgi:hypothetical protein
VDVKIINDLILYVSLYLMHVMDKKINLLLIFLLACKTLPDEYNNYGYLMMEHGRLQFRTCPEGTIYRHGLCGCDTLPTTFRGGRRRMGRRLKGEY